MKIKTLLALAIVIGITASSVSAQRSRGSVTFTDHLGQRISIGRAGIVRSVINKEGRRLKINSNFLICLCSSCKCLESTDPLFAATPAILRVDFPRRRTTLREGETLRITATLKNSNLKLTRKLRWLSGSSVVNISATVAASQNSTVCTLSEAGTGLDEDDPCPPSAAGVKCPDEWSITSGKTELTKPLRILAGLPVQLRFEYDFSIRRLAAVPD